MMKLKSPTLLYTLIVSLGGFIFGFDASVISGTVNFIASEFELSTWEQGFVVSSPTLGGIIATISAGAVCDAIGRRKTLIIIALLYLISAFASAFAVSYEMLVAARFIGGMAFCSLMIAPIYIAEISRAETRGKMVSVNQLNIVLGFSVSYFSNYFLLQQSQIDTGWLAQMVDQHNVWRFMLGMEIIPALAWFLLLFTIPRSPRWLLLNNQKEEAHQVIHTLFDEQDANDQIKEIYQLNQRSKPRLAEALKELFSKKMHFAILVGLIVGISQQVTGINVIFFYAPTVFEQSGVGTNAAFMQAIWIGLVNVAFTLVAMATIDKFGRKPLLIIGLIGVIISMSICSYGFKQATYQLTEQDVISLEQNQNIDRAALNPLVDKTFNSDVEFKNTLIDALGEKVVQQHQGELIKLATEMNATLILIGIMAFVASFAMSLGPVMWVMFSEIFPNHIRGIAISLVGVVNSAVSFLVQLVFPWELATLGAAMTFMGYGLFALIGLIMVIRRVPETKGKTLEQLEQQLSGTPAAGSAEARATS